VARDGRCACLLTATSRLSAGVGIWDPAGLGLRPSRPDEGALAGNTRCAWGLGTDPGRTWVRFTHVSGAVTGHCCATFSNRAPTTSFHDWYHLSAPAIGSWSCDRRARARGQLAVSALTGGYYRRQHELRACALPRGQLRRSALPQNRSRVRWDCERAASPRVCSRAKHLWALLGALARGTVNSQLSGAYSPHRAGAV